MDKQHQLPKQCLFLNADGEIMRIEYGKPGFQRFELSTENKQANREIVNIYNMQRGITAEQVELMHQGALVGWQSLHHLTDEDSYEKNDRIFEVEISRPGSFGAQTTATLMLPAEPYALLDALDKARITDDRVIYSSEIIQCELDYLPRVIGANTNLYELNHLAQRLSAMNEWELDCFEGIVMMETGQSDHALVAIDRLINMTHSTKHCQIAYGAHDDLTLGRFYTDNDFVQALEGLPEKIFDWLDYAKIGKEMREDEGGVFTPRGYVVQTGEIAEIYQSGNVIPLKKPDYTVLLRITKGYFNDSQDDSDLFALLKLPANDEAFSQALEVVEAASLEECAFFATDCIVPYLTEKINDELYESEGDRYGAVNELAQQLRRIMEGNRIPTYKAMLEAAPKDLSLEEAMDLAGQTVDFQLLRKIPSPVEYAQAELIKHDIPLKDVLIGSKDLYNYGQKLMEAQGAMHTDYGVLLSEDGITVAQCLGRPGQQMEMKIL